MLLPPLPELLKEPEDFRLLDEESFLEVFFGADPEDDGGMGGTLVLFAISEPVRGLGGKWNDTDPIEGDDIFVLLALAAMAEA